MSHCSFFLKSAVLMLAFSPVTGLKRHRTRAKPLAVLALLLLPLLPLVAQNKDEKAVASWTEKIRISGDFRYRHEFISQEIFNSATSEKVRMFDRNRHRLRLRLELMAPVNDKMDVFTRIATGSFSDGAGDPTSSNQDLSGGFAPKPIWLDRAYVDFHPFKELGARAGKQPVPFEHTDLVWDSDLNLEGMAVMMTLQKDGNELFLRAGGFWASERGPTGFAKHALTQGLFGGQLGGKVSNGRVTAQLAAAYFDYGNVKNNPALYAPNQFFGNSSTLITGRGSDTLGYLFDYNLVNVRASLGGKLNRVEPTAVFDFVTNIAAEKDDAYDKKLNSSWLAGFVLQFSSAPITWDVAYNYRVQQKDATIAIFADSDPAGGGTNYNGHKIVLGFDVMKQARFGLTYFKNIKDPENKNEEQRFDYDRVQADFEVKF
ncbi:MAG: hypothetical protein FJY66_04335 [Calditrichaeota bacterium]|nr:hypothetical protein [Calditrichota bacterium]